jgi:hypothetical protein
MGYTALGRRENSVLEAIEVIRHLQRGRLMRNHQNRRFTQLSHGFADRRFIQPIEGSSCFVEGKMWID